MDIPGSKCIMKCDIKHSYPRVLFILKVSTDYTVISGHQRLRIAKELGLTSVPIEIVDPVEVEDVKSGMVTPEQYLEYLLIAENVERRGQAEADPIKKARIRFFKGVLGG